MPGRTEPVRDIVPEPAAGASAVHEDDVNHHAIMSTGSVRDTIQPMTAVWVLNGPNLNLLGRREPEIYGSATLADLEQACRVVASDLGWDLDFRQSNHEGRLVDWLHEAAQAQASGELAGVVLNAGALTHTSVAVGDAIAGGAVRVIEVHIGNVYAREEFRHHSYVSPVAAGIIVGLGTAGYRLAIRALADLVQP
jgi:3-dehydroquinate dehydratase II